MSKPIPPVQKYMTTSPHTVASLSPVAEAAKLMRGHRIRHLPVLDDNDKVIGLISDRDIAILEGLVGVDPTVVTVRDAMAKDPYVVSPFTPVTEVAEAMAAHKYGSAIVAQNGKVVGMFTTVDACRTLAELFETRLR